MSWVCFMRGVYLKYPINHFFFWLVFLKKYNAKFTFRLSDNFIIITTVSLLFMLSSHDLFTCFIYKNYDYNKYVFIIRSQLCDEERLYDSGEN